MSENYMEHYRRWISEPSLDRDTREELAAMAEDDEKLRFRFNSYLEFGTGGLRGVMGAGINAMNEYTVAHATQGLATLILREGKAEQGVVVGYDPRLNSRRFAEVASSVLAANGIPVYLFDGVRPTPLVSFAIRELGCISGINITASHNPSEYNGYKAYWEDGAQLAPEFAEVVSASIFATDIFGGVKRVDFNDAIKDGRIKYVGYALDEKFIENALAERVSADAIPKVADDLRIVYTPFHGAGRYIVPDVLRRAGVKHLYPVPEQMIHDGSFPTVVSPNPENPEGFALGIKLAESVGSDLIIGTDPDSDRVGVMVRNSEGKFIPLSGNQVGALLLDYILTALEGEGGIPADGYAIKTIVSTELVTKICEVHGVKLYNVLTGFKFIGEVIKEHEEAGYGSYLFGFEESYGYLKGTYARDKDAVVASLLICEMAAYYKGRGMTLADALGEVYDRYGYYREKTVNVVMKGLDGIERMKALMEKMRKAPPQSIAGERVIAIRDYEAETITDLVTGAVTPTGLPCSNVLYYETEAHNVVVIRPSGTEPKIKLYLLIHGENAAEADEVLARFAADIEDWTK